MAEIQWIKIVTDIFDNRKIRLLEKMPDGDSIIVIWFKLLCLAGQTNDNGLIYLTREVPYTPEMLSDYFNRPISTVKMALMAFERFEMIEVVNDIILLPGWEKYQSQEALERIREQNRLRKQRQRERQKNLMQPQKQALPDASGNVTDGVTCHVTITQSHAIEEEKEIDKDTDIDRDIEEKSTAELPGGAPGAIAPDPKPAKASRFKPPTLEEVRAYCLERGNNIDPEKFHAYYESVKWYRGKTKIQDWKACVRTWESKERPAPGQAQRQQYPPHTPPPRKGGNVFLDILNNGM